MNTSPTNGPERVLVVGRSPSVLVATVDVLRAKGYAADATNQFDKVLDHYDVTDLDVLVFGGMVPADTKQHLREDVSERNPHVTFVQGLAGIPGLIATQVQAAISAETLGRGDVAYDAARRSVQLTLTDSAPVTVEAWWHTSFVPPEPKSASMNVFDGQLDAGPHIIPLPDRVPSEASFAGVTVGSLARVFIVGPMPNAVTRLQPTSAADNRLPQVSQVTTSSDDREAVESGSHPESRAQTMPAQGLANLVVRALLRTPGISRVVGGRLVTLYVVGRKSKRRYAIPVAYLIQGDGLLIGTSFAWVRNLRSGEAVAIRLKGKLRQADIQTYTRKIDVVSAYAHMARVNPAFAKFNKLRIDEYGEPARHDLELAWLGGARAIRLTPR